MDVVIETFPARRLATVRHTGPYPGIADAFHRLGALAAQSGLYDHVAPALMTPPGTVHLDSPEPLPEIPAAGITLSGDDAAVGFGYTVSGGRVPAILISPMIASATTIRPPADTPFDHATIVKTVWDAFGLSNDWTSLTERDENAPTLFSSEYLSATVNNDPGAFSGTIVANPMVLVFDNLATQVLQASAGPKITLSVTYDTSLPWLTVSTAAGDTGTNLLLVTVTVDKSQLSSTQNTTITITASNGTSLPVPVWGYA